MKSCSYKAKTKPYNMSGCFDKHHSSLHGSRAAPLRDIELTWVSPLAPEHRQNFLLKLLHQNRELRKQLEGAQAGTLHQPAPVIKVRPIPTVLNHPTLVVEADPVTKAVCPAIQYCRKEATEDLNAEQDPDPDFNFNQIPDETQEKEDEYPDQNEGEIPENTNKKAEGDAPSASGTSVHEGDIPQRSTDTKCVPEEESSFWTRWILH